MIFMDLKQVFTIQKFYIAFEIFSFSMILPYLIRNFTREQILSGYLLLFFSPLLFIMFLKKIYTRGFMIAGFVIRFFSMFIFFVKPNLANLYLYFFSNGMIILFFWVPYNIRYFMNSHKMNRATSAGHFVIVGPILNSFIPLISAYIITSIGYNALAVVSFLLCSVLIYKTTSIDKLDLDYSFFDALKKSSGLLSLKFLQGFFETGNMLVALFALNFVKTELGFGSFLSYIGLVGVVATLFVTRFSDKQNKRLKYFFPFLIILAGAMIYLSRVDTFFMFIIISAVIGVMVTLTFPFFFAIVLDKIEDKTIAMITREFMLNFGRVCSILLILILMRYGLNFEYLFMFSGLSLVIYSILLFTKKVYIEEAYYPLSPVAKVYDKSKNLALKVYSWGKVVEVKGAAKLMYAKLYTGTRWVDVSLRRT